MKKLNKKGFTLIELIVVIAILAILAAILIPALTNYIQKATNTKNTANCRSLYTKYALDIAVSSDPANVTKPTTANLSDSTAMTVEQSGGAVTTFSCTFTGGRVTSLANNFAVPTN